MSPFKRESCIEMAYLSARAVSNQRGWASATGLSAQNWGLAIQLGAQTVPALEAATLSTDSGAVPQRHSSPDGRHTRRIDLTRNGVRLWTLLIVLFYRR